MDTKISIFNKEIKNIKIDDTSNLEFTKYSSTVNFNKLFQEKIRAQYIENEEGEYIFDISNTCLNPENLELDTYDCWYNKIQLWDNCDISCNNFISNLKSIIPLISNGFPDLIAINNYYKSIRSFTEIWNLFSQIYDNDFTNKFFVLGSGDFIEQIFPKFMIDHVIETNAKYEIYIIEPCEDAFGCPNFDELYDKLKEKLGSNQTKLKNFKINHLVVFIDKPSLFYTIYKLNKVNNKNIIYDTIDTGGNKDRQLNNYNSSLVYFNNITANDFQNCLINGKINIYFGTGLSFIYYDKIAKIFKLVRFNSLKLRNCEYNKEKKDCPLNEFPLDRILNNDFHDFDFTPYQASAGGYYNKYLKYKAKYLQLKSTLTKQSN